MYLLIVFFLKTLSPLVLLVPTCHQNPSPQTGLQDLLVTQYDCEENEQKTLNKYAINQVTQCKYLSINVTIRTGNTPSAV